VIFAAAADLQKDDYLSYATSGMLKKFGGSLGVSWVENNTAEMNACG
jgi:hypothetical protein